ncbi:hypothetical protein A2303_05245 [Candidatus Falkowbacteria bacterium RIFOXYB2_FULL_47_14]|uniref:Phospholipase/carboxylesterase/thioesterase domain-containing protein n=1 Tax=Candidatus Falkowbacteria bacterium RIFOXYA2_FULL_47_19 TaxID=1797994 RepID=A0A1F5SJC6_9BACT|nr:MAG: hypothetical protein A2227_06625 [Candidatus Falkowbacteria bacterium RIFOXYA2_FULL_47_19]OGF35413.1 MAG: hypothetical protein A2468_02995 [Candidatus Falkowbacteria bacterium RIFOXYC2_FULL_46_15]OGF43320.1 MAG: hypothetical protein A2303_05245 [Candidatus Falkowbacteria bacterium RIFOXYB2_FULL_47_14]
MKKSYLIVLSLMVFLPVSGWGLSFFKSKAQKSSPTYVQTAQAGPSEQLRPGDYRRTAVISGIQRYYLLHVPRGLEPGAPLVFALHGSMLNAEMMSKSYNWKKKADEEKFLVVFPNGTSRLASGKFANWNAGNCCGYAQESDSDDVGFIRSVIDDIEGMFDTGKIYVTGISNGAMMAYRLACEMPEKISAIAPVAGTDNTTGCTSEGPVSVMHVHSLLDPRILYEGGCGPDCVTEIQFVSVHDTIKKWTSRNQCASETERILENGYGYCDEYGSCANGTKVRLCTTEDGGHSWPTGSRLGQASQAFNATDEIWDFFESLN